MLRWPKQLLQPLNGCNLQTWVESLLILVKSFSPPHKIVWDDEEWTQPQPSSPPADPPQHFHHHHHHLDVLLCHWFYTTIVNPKTSPTNKWLWNFKSPNHHGFARFLRRFHTMQGILIESLASGGEGPYDMIARPMVSGLADDFGYHRDLERVIMMMMRRRRMLVVVEVICSLSTYDDS